MKSAIIAGYVSLSVLSVASAAHANPEGLYPKPVKTQKFQGIPAKKPPYVTRECITKFSPNGKFENEKEAKACVRAWNGTIANPSKGHWRWVFPPPPEYDIPYTGVLMVQRLPIEQVHKVCAPTQLACAMVVSTVPDPNGDQASGKSILTVIAPLVSLLCRPTTTSENIPRKNPKKNFATKPGTVMDGPQTILAAKADGYG